MHDIRYNEVNDEIIVSNPFANAILVFRGGAPGPPFDDVHRDEVGVTA